MDRSIVVEDEIFLHLEDEQRSKTGVFEMNVRMNIRLIEIAHGEEESLLVHKERLGEHEALLDMESGALLLDFLYQHRDALDEAMHRIVE